MDRIKQNFRLRSGRSARPKTNGMNGSAITSVPFHDSVWDGYQRPATAKVDNYTADPKSNEQSHPFLPIMRDSKHGPDSPAFSFNSTAPLPALPANEAATEGHLAPVQERVPSLRRKQTLQPDALPSEPLTKILDAGESSSDDKTYDLKPPPPRTSVAPMETLSDMLFSQDHLETILQDPRLFARFTAFLNTYRPHSAPVLVRYLETAKAMKAVQYANAIAVGLSPVDGERASHAPLVAATIDPRFESKSKRCFENLLLESLPAFITYKLVKLVTDLLIKEMTGAQIPMLRELVAGLTEVFCITDPNLPDNPIVFASAEFYRMTGYERDFVIGKNCRFLQGFQKTQRSVVRIRHAIRDSEEVSEILLNYRKDGTSFLNCLNIAPLLDDEGKVRYFIGAQVDVSGLIEGGKGLDSFERLLTTQRLRRSLKNTKQSKDDLHLTGKEVLTNELLHSNPLALERLKELSEMFDLEEAAVVQTHSRSNSLTKDSDDPMFTFHKDKIDASNAQRRLIIDQSLRRVESEEDFSHASNDNDIVQGFSTLSPSAQSGKLPGVYQSYFLVRPAPSLRIVFVSPSLHYLGRNLLQSRFLSHISAPEGTLAGLKEAFIAGAPVTAKVAWHKDKSTPESDGQGPGHTKWLSATPLFGSNDKIGVWMIIMIDRHKSRDSHATDPAPSSATGSVSRTNHPRERMSSESRPRTAASQHTYSMDRHTTRPSTVTAHRAATPPFPPILYNDDPLPHSTESPPPPTSWKGSLHQYRSQPPPESFPTRSTHRTSTQRHRKDSSNSIQNNHAITTTGDETSFLHQPSTQTLHSQTLHYHPPQQEQNRTDLTRENLEAASAIAAAAATTTSPGTSTPRHNSHHRAVNGYALHHHNNPNSHDDEDDDGFVEARSPPDENDNAHANAQGASDTDDQHVIRHVTTRERQASYRGSRKERVVVRNSSTEDDDDQKGGRGRNGYVDAEGRDLRSLPGGWEVSAE